MKIIGNIIPVIKIYDSLRYLKKHRKNFLAARAEGDFEKEREHILKTTEVWGSHIVKTFDIKLNVEGRENIPGSGPVVFVANHQGYADIPISCAVLNKFQFGFIAKNDLEKLPFYGEWIKSIRSVMIERDDARASLRAIEEGVSLIEQGFSMLVFPEGTRSKGGPMKEFKKGSLRLATKPGVPVIPITINGTYRMFEEHGVVRNGTHVDFIIHPGIETKGMSRSEANGLPNMAEGIIKDKLLEIIEREGGMHHGINDNER